MISLDVQTFEFREHLVKMARVFSRAEFESLLDTIDLSPPFIIKPNWINQEYAHHTDPEVLTWLLGYLSSIGKTVVTEAYSARNNPPGSAKQERGILLEHLRRSDEAFLVSQGLLETFRELGVQYVNVDEEMLAGRFEAPDSIRRATDSQFEPVADDSLYSYVPTKLYELRGGTFVSFAKFKLTFSMCTKNLFGMIPELSRPGGRGSYHGRKDRDLPRNIIDINKIYRASFNVVGLVEGINSLTGRINRGSYHSMFGYDYEVEENTGTVFFGTDPLWLDAFVCALSRMDPRDNPTSAIPEPHLSLGYDELSAWPDELVSTARSLSSPLTPGQ